MDTSQDFKSLQDKIQAALVATTRTVNQIANEDLSFLRTANPTNGDRLDEHSSRLLSLATEVLNAAANANGQKPITELEDVEDTDIQWSGIVDVIDGLLEKADISLDEYTGRVKRKHDFPEAAAPSKKAKTNDRNEINWRRANIMKPQNAFEQKFNNFTTAPWKPILTTKPHASVPLEESLRIIIDENGQEQYTHPYEPEITKLEYSPTTYAVRDPIPYQPIESTAPIWVDTYEGVLEMLEELKQATEIAVDLEHHDLRTYTGLLSLMQISTREKDWVIDTLRPWRHKLEVLNEVFADPKILKVFHGAFMDIIWLQRDLGLYIVGLFDTFHASSALEFPQKSLAYLLKTFVDFNADKRYQMADWRIRPLTDEMLYYARCDTHYLLYVYDVIRNELVKNSDSSSPEKNLIEYTLERSKETSLDRYTYWVPDSATGEGGRGWANSLLKTSIRLDGSQFAVYRAIHSWRDTLARTEDESPMFIMPPTVLMDISRLLPSDPKALWSLLGGKCAAIVPQKLDELFDLIVKAKETGVNGPSSTQFFRTGTLDNSMAAVAQREFGQKEKVEPDLPPVQELRSQQSQLFGPIPVSSRWEQAAAPLQDANGQLIPLPWTSFVQEAAVSAAHQEAEAKALQKQRAADMIPLVDPAPAPAPAKQEPIVEDNEFTLRQGRKRKLDKVQPSDDSDDDDEEEEDDDDDEGGAAVESQDMIMLNEDGEDPAARKARKRAEKKARKVAVRAMKAEAKRGRGAARRKAAAENGDDEQPFDYSTAQSVLHAQRVAANEVVVPKGKKAFDPYAARMSAEGPKPARRMHGERPGKTATFRK
ncbi:ribonuclease H-like domain-containing protein [Coniella lustricola]|uniref:Ribonuclease H-like domain-containing protein n=1 Tax=Coniella lustricola TaxID=2025994 RepID=A0A2T3A7Q5_9PEZI|nr:ribonuclease H-like domain-containing protein [Coniella lustricola]